MSNDLSKEEVLRVATGCLRKMFADRQRTGMLAVYVWGSITRDDFDPLTSDIDSIAVVAESFPLELNESIKQELVAALPDTEWGFQIIYKSELDGGELKSRLAKAMAPQSILPSFQDWAWVAGQKFKRSDFALPDATPQERMRLDIAAIDRRYAGLSDPDAYIRKRHRKGLIKACLQLIYDRQLARSEYFPLNYNHLDRRADELEQPMLRALLETKDGELYTVEHFERLAPRILAFRNQVESEL